MFGHEPYYFGTMRKMEIYFSTIFNNILIERKDNADDLIQKFRVPIQHGPKDRELARVKADPNIDRKAAIVLPRMSFAMTGISYDGSRKLATMNRIIRTSDDVNKVRRQYEPVPYDLTFTLSIYAAFTEDASKIVEAILPFFSPDFTATVNVVPEMNIEDDIPVILMDVQKSDTYEGGYDTENRMIIWDLTFVMKAKFYGPIVKKPIIKIAEINTYVGNTSDPQNLGGTATVYPGMTANGEATTNAAAAVNVYTVSVNDDWGYISTYTGQTFSNT